MQLSQWFNLNIENGNFIVFLFDVFNTMQFDEMMYIVPALACENVRFPLLFDAGDVSPRETFPAAKSEEKQIFS